MALASSYTEKGSKTVGRRIWGCVGKVLFFINEPPSLSLLPLLTEKRTLKNDAAVSEHEGVETQNSVCVVFKIAGCYSWEGLWVNNFIK
jgi:hypothetical protein